ncbi:MAG: phage terminase large subunit, partial [Lachnospiraceae bacterium]|nr:phage terminase large subunit [Lachnospiraceae bacterium]
MSSVTMRLAKPYDRILTTDKRTVVMYSPRISGKSHALAQIVYAYANMYPKHDIVVTRAHYNSLEDSIYNEILATASDLGVEGFYTGLKSPLRIKTRKGNTIYFKGIGGSDYNRSKGFKGTNPISLIICDETQQLKDEQSLRQAVATFIRSIDASINSKIILAGNPEPIKAHWWNAYCRRYRYAGVYEFIDSNYLCIYKYLSQVTRDEIETERIYNPPMYKFMYLGELDELSGGAYASFKREKHYIAEKDIIEEVRGEYLTHIIWGGDGAITHDSTGITPIGVFSNGRAYVLERFYYDPLKTGIVLAPSQITELILDYVAWMDRKYGIIRDDIGSTFYIDGAAADLITQLRYTIYQHHLVRGFTRKNIINNNAVVNNCFAKNMCKVVNYGGYFDWYRKEWVDTTADTEPLVVQLESVVWKDYKLDPSIPNDYTDALTY